MSEPGTDFGAIVVAVSMVLGSLLMLIASLGIIRMPDLFCRMQAATKASALGTGLIMLGVALYFGNVGITTRVIAMILFVFLTVPVAAHKLGRAAYLLGVPLWDGTVEDELQGRYHPETEQLSSGPAAADPQG